MPICVSEVGNQIEPNTNIYSLSNASGPIMNTYEIRIVRKGMEKADIFSSSHISDHAAVRRAHALADSGDLIEVWRGTACVFSGELALH